MTLHDKIKSMLLNDTDHFDPGTTAYDGAINDVLAVLKENQRFEYSSRKTTNELGEEKYPGRTFDTALPQLWVNCMLDRGFDPRGHFVTLYPERGQNNLGFYMAPITPEGIEMVARVASMEA